MTLQVQDAAAIDRPEFSLFDGAEAAMPSSQSRKIVAVRTEMQGGFLIPMGTVKPLSMLVHSRTSLLLGSDSIDLEQTFYASSLIGRPAISSSFRTFSRGIDSLSATSSGFGSRPTSFNMRRDVRTTLLTDSMSFGGI
jgi:hypothetical protein